MNKNTLIERLQLAPHPEGGYFRRSFASDHQVQTGANRYRPAMSSIFYLLTDDSPVGYWHRNKSDIMHYFHCGSALDYWLIDPRGQLQHVIMGTRLEHGQQLQVMVPGGYWKATELVAGEFALLSEAVSPGFCEQDREIATAAALARSFPQHHDIIERLAKPAELRGIPCE
jgi:predicted cupin superfamily sugar epimerase